MKIWPWAVGLAAAIIAVFWVKHYTMLLDSKDSAVILDRIYEYQDDYSNPQLLSQKVDHIFIGEVIEEKGSGDHAGNPATVYGVRVTQNIKGALLGGLTVVQDGGYYKEDGELYFLRYEKDELLREGRMYLFYVMAEQQGTYWMMPKYGHTAIDTEEQKYELIDEVNSMLEGK